MCCRVERCCFCFHHVLGVKLLGALLIAAELTLIVVTTLYLPQFLFAVGPTSCIGIFCDIFLLVAVYRLSRWFMLPWLIYIMIVIVGLGLAAVLQVVIPLGAVRQPDWLLVIVGSAGCLAVAGLLLYFWIVVLELFIRLGPIYEGQDPYLSQCRCPHFFGSVIREPEFMSKIGFTGDEFMLRSLQIGAKPLPLERRYDVWSLGSGVFLPRKAARHSPRISKASTLVRTNLTHAVTLNIPGPEQVYATPTYPVAVTAAAYPIAAGAIPIQPYVGGYNQGPPSVIYQQPIAQPYGAA